MKISGKSRTELNHPSLGNQSIRHCNNKFALLGEDNGESDDAILVGYSMIHKQVAEFCGRDCCIRRNFCFPGAKVDISEALDTVIEEASEKTVVIVHADTYDVCRTQSEEILDKYQQLIL